MKLPNKLAGQLLNKDRNKAQDAARSIINNKDVDAWKCLLDHSEFIFDYIKDKAGKTLLNAVNQENYRNLFELISIHSPDWDFYIAKAFANNKNEELNNKFIDILKNGTEHQKAYVVKYFELIRLDSVREILFNALKTDYEPLKTNIAKALGVLEDQKSFEFFLDKLHSDDDWDKVEAAEFLSAFGNKEAVFDMLEAMSNSSMADCISAEIATLDDLYKYFDVSDESLKEQAMEAFDHILSGLAEVWSLGVLFDFKVYECIEKLIELAKTEDSYSGRYAQLLLKARVKMRLFIENDQYIYDEDKNTVNELEEVSGLILSQCQDFWDNQMQNLENELDQGCVKRKIATVNLIKDMKIKDYSEKLAQLLHNEENSLVCCEAVLALGELNAIDKISNKDQLLTSIKDENIKAVIKHTLF